MKRATCKWKRERGEANVFEANGKVGDVCHIYPRQPWGHEYRKRRHGELVMWCMINEKLFQRSGTVQKLPQLKAKGCQVLQRA